MKYYLKAILYGIKEGWKAFNNYGKAGFVELNYRGIPIIQRNDVPSGTVYVMKEDSLTPKRKKDGTPDMRYRINRRLFKNESNN